MYISRQPLRVSLVGGGLDFPEYFQDNYVATLGFSIDQYVYTQFSWQVPIFKHKYRLGFSQATYHEELAEISNRLVKEIYTHFNIKDHCEVQTLSDLPNVSGLGGSSSFCLGILDIFNRSLNLNLSMDKIVRLAVEIERRSNNFSGGIQDQYHIGNPGLNLIEYAVSNRVRVRDLSIVDEANFFESCVIIFERDQSTAGTGRINRGIGSSGLPTDIVQKMSKLCELAEVMSRKKRLSTNDLRLLFQASCRLKRTYDKTHSVNPLTEFLMSKGIDGWKYCGAPGSNSIFLLESPEIIEQLQKCFNLQYHFVSLNFGFPKFVEL